MNFASLPIEELSNAFSISNSSIFTMIYLLTIVVIQSSFFFTTISGDVYLQLYLHPHTIGELLLTYSVTQSVFSRYVEPLLLRSPFNSNLHLRTNKRMIITNVFSNSSIFTMILLTIVFASCTNRELC